MMTKEDKKLSGPQQKAINLFLAGLNDTQVGEQVGVARSTVNKWKNKNPNFGAELDRQQQELNQENRLQLSGLVGQSIQVLRQSLASENERIRLSASVHVLKATGLYGQDHETTSSWAEQSETAEADIQTLIAQFRAMGAQVIA